MATATGTMAAYRKKRSSEMKDSKAESTRDLLTKVDRKKCSSRQTKTKSIPTEQADHSQTGQPSLRQTRGKNNAEKTNRHRAPIAPREGRYLRVTAVNRTKTDQDVKRPKSSTNWGHPPGSTACTHPTTNTTSTAAAATRGARKTKTSIPPAAACRGGLTHRQQVKKPSISQRPLPPSSILVPDVVAEAVQCPREKVESQLSSLTSASQVTLAKPPQLERDDVISQLEKQTDGASQLDWKDVPDPDTGTDPCFCGEYIKDIYTYLLELEVRPVYTIREDFLSHQLELRRQHRNILVDWLVQVQQRFILLPETLYLAIDILDRSLQVSLSKYIISFKATRLHVNNIIL